MESIVGRSFKTAFAALALAPAAAHADHSLATASGSTGGPILTVGADTLAPGQWVAGLRFTYDRPDQRSDSTLADLAAHHVHAHNADYTLRSSASLAYGLADHLTVAASLPYIRRDDFREGEHSHSGGVAANEVVRQGSISGVGDLTLGLQYLLAHDHDAGWAVALLAGVKVPTGSTHERTPDGERFETEHQPGTGSWDPFAGLAATRQIGATRIDSNLVYQVSSRGAQRTELGDRATASIAVSRGLGKAHHHEGGIEEHSHGGWSLSLEATGEWEGRQRIAGEIERDSGGKAIFLAPGVRYVAAFGWSVGTALALPLWQDIRASHPDNRYRLTLAIGRAF